MFRSESEIIGPMDGSIDVIVAAFAVVLPKIKAQTIKGLALTGRYRQPNPPDLPTFKGVSLPGVGLSGWLRRIGAAADAARHPANFGKVVKWPAMP